MTADDTTPAALPGTIGTYANLAGTPVLVTRHTDPDQIGYDDYWRKALDCSLRCQGCDSGTKHWNLRHEEDARCEANKHAGTCRARVQTPDPSAEIRAEVTGLRADVASIAEALRDLAATIGQAAAAVPDIAEAISDIPDPAAAVESLAAQAYDKPRRWWRR